MLGGLYPLRVLHIWGLDSLAIAGGHLLFRGGRCFHVAHGVTVTHTV